MTQFGLGLEVYEVLLVDSNGHLVYRGDEFFTPAEIASELYECNDLLINDRIGWLNRGVRKPATCYQNQ